jgi:preprotein translocase subunit YajC
MFISEAFAQAATGPASPMGDLGQFLPFVLILVVFYFLMWRPQARKAKQHKEMVAALRRGDKVVLNSGIYGTVSKVVDEQVALIEIAENVKIRVARAAISEIQSKTEPAPAVKDAPKEAASEEAAPEEDKK